MKTAVGDAICHTPKDIDIAEQNDQLEKILFKAQTVDALGFQVERDDFVVDSINSEQGKYYFISQKTSMTS